MWTLHRCYGIVARETEPMAEEHVQHPWESWVWDATVFKGTANYYRQGRNPYAPTLAEALAKHLQLDGRGRLLDVGCGPGSIALLFAHLFESVVGLDPDPGMLIEAQRAAVENQIAHASWPRCVPRNSPRRLAPFE